MALILAFIGALVRVVGPITAQVMLALGFSFLSFTGIDLAVNEMKDAAFASINGQGQLFIQFIGVFQIGTAINMVASAYLGRMLLQGVVGGKLTKMVTKS
jgi:hypothetical protein